MTDLEKMVELIRFASLVCLIGLGLAIIGGFHL